MRNIALLLPLLAACSREEPAANNAASQVPAANAATAAEPSTSPPIIDPRSAEAAVAVLRDYFRLIAEKKYVDAHRLWSTDPQDTDLSDGAFAESFARYRTYHAEIGAPGRVEGAAGSLYVDVPVEISGHFTTGNAFRETGAMTLRRANDVPGATEEQLQWRIARAELEPGQAASYRFVGRWAADVRQCDAPWRFTATSLKTPAGAACAFSKVTEVPGGFDISASCTAKGPPRDDRLKLRFAESAKALLFESGTIADTGLVRCR